MSKVFISYRRADSQDTTGRLHDYLAGHLGANAVFIDIDDIEPGENFGAKIQTTLEKCDAVLVMIGSQWNAAVDGGEGRLHDPEDWVRKELDAALSSDKKVIPVLVGESEMPAASSLPEVLTSLTDRNAVRLRSGADFSGDARKILQAVGFKKRSTIKWVAAAAMLAIAAATFYALQPFTSDGTNGQTQSISEALIDGMALPDADVSDRHPNLIVNERLIGEKYGIINDKPWRRRAMVVSDESNREFFQPRGKLLNGKLYVLYLAKAWNDPTLYVREYQPLSGENKVVDSISWTGGYTFDWESNMQIRGEYLYYAAQEDGRGRRYQIGGSAAPTDVEFFPGDARSMFYTSKSPSGRFIVAANAGYISENAPSEFKLATQGQDENGEFTGISLYDYSTNTNSVLFKQRYTGDWSIGSIVWADDSESLFFDNSGAVACIWKYTLNHRLLQKIVPEHEARSPFFLRIESRDFVLYVETTGQSGDDIRSRLMVTTE